MTRNTRFALAFMAIISALPMPASAFNQPMINQTPPDALCAPMTTTLCQTQVSLPATVIGGTTAATLPERFETRSITFQCISMGNGSYYQAMTPLTCALRSCTPNKVHLCDTDIDVLNTVNAGDSVQINIPRQLLASTERSNPPVVYAQCGIENGVPAYGVKDAFAVPCSTFACQPVQLQACNAPLTVTGTSDLGAVLQLETPSYQPVEVQCLATEDGAPHYKVIDQNCF